MYDARFQYIHDLERYTTEFEINTHDYVHEYPSPLDKIRLKGNDIWIKMEDQLSLGCAKQRSIVYMIGKYIEQGKTRFVVSSSGNAALVAAYVAYCSESDVEEVIVLLSESISDDKLQKFIDILGLSEELAIEDIREGAQLEKVKFDLSNNPKQRAFQHEKHGYVNLRGSVDDLAICGFKSIAVEITQQMKDKSPDAIFVPASSGTTALGIFEGFKELSLNPQMHVVQTTKANALLKKLMKLNLPIELDHPAESIIDVIGHRRKQIEHIISYSGGDGWVINSEECHEAKKELKSQFNLNASYDSALTYAALKAAIRERDFKNPVLVFTG